MADLADWLAGLGLGKYAPAFAEQEIDFDLLPLLTEADVHELGLPIGPRRKLLDAIATLRGEHRQGSEKPRRQNEAERRQLTVMFVDMAESTPLALQLDPEAMRDVLHAFQNAVTGEIGRLGYVAKLMGDGVLAYFGWPHAHEDDTRRAVTAALAITEAVARLQSPTGEKLACRIGIATGMVVVGDLVGEGAAQEHTVVGPTPNLAARLQEAAGPGEIMIAETTRRLLGSGFDVEPVGQRLLKGHADPIPVFRVLPGTSRESGFALDSSEDFGPLVGREAELTALRHAWADATAGNIRTVLLIGEAGIGKSRLVRELDHAVGSTAGLRQVFQCSALHRENPLWPVLQRLPSAATLLERMADQGAGYDRARAQREIVEAVATRLLSVGSDGPAFLVFEDAQWADRATVELIQRLAVADLPLLLIVTSRPEREPRLGARANLLRMSLPRLDAHAAGALLASVAGHRRLSARLRSEILARSDGIPLFVEEITKAVLEAAPSGTPVSVPATLRDSLIARLDISPTAKTAAQIAACIGREFDEHLLFRVADVSSDELRDGLAALLKVSLVLTTAAGQFRFKHALVCDIAYESLLTPRRQRLHQRIAEALEAMPDDIAEREPESLAHHWFAAGQSGRAEVYWLRARHRIAHWHEQLDALADYLDTDTGEVIPFPGGPGLHKLH